MFSLEYSLGLINPDYPHVLEFGVCTGTTLRTIRDNLGSRFKVYGFDSFEGLPEDWPGTVCRKGEFAAEQPDIAGVEFFQGWFKDTIHDYVKQAEPIALLHLDCDLYSSTKDVLWPLNPFILPGTIIVCDEWIYKLTSGGYGDDQEQKAVSEWASTFGRHLEHIPFSDLEPLHGNERRIFRVAI